MVVRGVMPLALAISILSRSGGGATIISEGFAGKMRVALPVPAVAGRARR